MIEVESVSKDYGVVTALEEVSFCIGRGEIVGLLGPNGAGKTTLLKILTGFFEPTVGSVRMAGIDVVDQPVQARTHVGYLPENAPLYPEMLVQEALLMTADLRGLAGLERDRKLRRAVESTGLHDVLTEPIGRLSKGYRQRVGLAQAILPEPAILILDEPTNGLDPAQIVEVRHLIRKQATIATVILSTHILSEVEKTCERVLVLLNGRLQADARLSELTATGRYRAVFAEGAPADAIRDDLSGLSGIRVLGTDEQQGRPVVFIEGEPGADVGELVFEKAKAESWPLRALDEHTRTLESVFADLLSGQEVRL